MDQEFTDLVNMTFDCDLRVEIVYEAIKIAQEHPEISPKLALEISIRDWDK